MFPNSTIPLTVKGIAMHPHLVADFKISAKITANKNGKKDKIYAPNSCKDSGSAVLNRKRSPSF
jgi:hypothetical protein